MKYYCAKVQILYKNCIHKLHLDFLSDCGKTKTDLLYFVSIKDLNISPELLVFLSAMLPVTELRGAIPLGFALGLPPIITFFWAVIGNIIPCFFILAFLKPVSELLRKYFKWFDTFFEKLFVKTREKHEQTIVRYGPIFLVVFVMIPLPGSGGWTGSLIAFLFGMKYWKSLGLIFIGLILAGTIITLGGTGISYLL